MPYFIYKYVRKHIFPCTNAWLFCLELYFFHSMQIKLNAKATVLVKSPVEFYASFVKNEI